MRNIEKLAEPPRLVTYRLSTGATYVDLPYKQLLRGSLVREQRGLCCYCMKRIEATSHAMKIEHWRSQRRYPEQQLDYRNLLGACDGGTGQPLRLQHCDTAKGAKDLSRNPANRDDRVQQRITYEVDGSIRSDDRELDDQLDAVLNLNNATLRGQRRSVMIGMAQAWSARRRQGESRERFVARHLARLEDPSTDLQPWDPLKEWWLRRRQWQQSR